MPSTITHSYIGLDTLKKVKSEPKKIIENHLNNYKVYCQNMDVLYFYHIFLLKSDYVQELGHAFHKENIFKYFKMMCDDNRKNKNEELFTFICGLITHYQADSIMHPYIDYLSKVDKDSLKIDGHFILETYLDNYFINKYETKNYKSFNNSNLVFNYTKEEIIEDEITKIFKYFWNYDNMGEKYYRALDEMAFVYRNIRYDKYGFKRKIYKIIDLLPFHNRKTEYLSYHFNLENDTYYLNLQHNKWYNIKNNKYTSTKSFLDLYRDVCNNSSKIINELYDYIFKDKNIDLKKLIGNISCADGLSINDN